MMKEKLLHSSKRIGLRSILVLSQFSCSIVLLVSTLVVFQQLHFMQTQNLGFKKDHNVVIDFQFGSNVKQHLETIKGPTHKLARCVSD